MTDVAADRVMMMMMMVMMMMVMVMAYGAHH